MGRRGAVISVAVVLGACAAITAAALVVRSSDPRVEEAARVAATPSVEADDATPSPSPVPRPTTKAGEPARPRTIFAALSSGSIVEIDTVSGDVLRTVIERPAQPARPEAISVSPDGRTLYIERAGGSCSRSGEILAVPADGGTAEVVAEGRLPAVDPTGAKLAYFAFEGCDGAPRLVVRDLSTDDEQVIAVPGCDASTCGEPGAPISWERSRVLVHLGDRFWLIETKAGGDPPTEILATVEGWEPTHVRIVGDGLTLTLVREDRLGRGAGTIADFDPSDADVSFDTGVNLSTLDARDLTGLNADPSGLHLLFTTTHRGIPELWRWSGGGLDPPPDGGPSDWTGDLDVQRVPGSITAATWGPS